MRARNFALSALPVLAVVFAACSDPSVSPASAILPEAVVAPLSALSAIPGSNTPTLIQSKLTADRCLNVTSALNVDGTPLMVYRCYPSATNEQFTWNSNAELRVFGSKCVDTKGGSSADGTPIVISTCNGSQNQKWTATAADEMRNVASGKCVDIAASSTNLGAAVVLTTCSGKTSQGWDKYGSTTAPAPTPPPPPPPTGTSPFSSTVNGGIRPRGFGQGTYALRAPTSGRVTYYVATTGSDNNPGSSAQPFRTINKAAQVARAGDVVTIRGGSYSETVRVANSGTSSAPIVFQAETRGSVVLTGGNYRFQPAGYTNVYTTGAQQYVTVRGLIFRQYSPISNPNIHAVEAVGGWVIEDCLFDAAGYTAIQVMGPNVTVTRTTIQNTYLLAIAAYINDGVSTSPQDPRYLAVDNLRITDVILTRNATAPLSTSSNGPGYSNKLIQTRGLVVDNIESYQNRGPGLWLDAKHSNYVIRNSYFHDNINALGSGAGGIGRGIHIEKSWGPGLVEDNVFYDNQSAAIFVNNSQGTTIRNNLMSGNTQCVLFVNTDGYPHDLKNVSIRKNQCRDWKQYAAIHTLGGTFTSPGSMNIVADSNVYQPVAVTTLGYWEGTGGATTIAQMLSKWSWERSGSIGTIAKP